jgi:pSer/pThr/pTyr-binding forkhead associated (FHA) protein
MRNNHPEFFDKTRPTLLITHGNTSRKVRPLEGEVILLGSSRNCQINLSGAEIIGVHCILLHSKSGWVIRDGGSRIGTRVNTEPVQEKALSHGDTIQVSTFMFELHLPKGADVVAAPTSPSRVERRTQRARQNLTRLALNLRRRLCERPMPMAKVPPTAIKADVADLHRQEARLADLIRQCEERTLQLDQAERAVALDRDTLAEGFACLQNRIQKTDQELAERRADCEAEIEARWQEFQQHCEEQVPVQPQSQPEDSSELLQRCNQRQRELDVLASHLLRVRRHLRDREAELDEQAVRIAEEVSALRREQQRWHRQREVEQRQEEEMIGYFASQRPLELGDSGEAAELFQQIAALEVAKEPHTGLDQDTVIAGVTVS